jgi:signal peptidase complex subunit 3
MHSLYQRFSNVSALLSSCLLCLVGAITLTSLIFPTTTQSGWLDVTSIEVHKGRKNYGGVIRSKLDTEFAFLKMNISAGTRRYFVGWFCGFVKRVRP